MVTTLFFFGFKVGKDNFLQQFDTFSITGPMIRSEGNIKATREIILEFTTLSFTTGYVKTLLNITLTRKLYDF